MLADVYIPRLSSDIKIAVQKNHLGGQILYRSLDPPKKTASIKFYFVTVKKGAIGIGQSPRARGERRFSPEL